MPRVRMLPMPRPWQSAPCGADAVDETTHRCRAQPLLARMSIPLLILLGCCGCFGQGPSAHRVRPDDNDRFYPQRDIHFVEHGHRSKGVLVSATPGFSSPFDANWRTVLVPTPPTQLDGPVWTGRASRKQAVEISELPSYRDCFSVVDLAANPIRFRFHERAVWILGTDPLVVGLAQGLPQRDWRELARVATGAGDGYPEPVPPLLARYVVDEELEQPLSRLVLRDADALAVVKLEKPMTVGQALDAIANTNPRQLGAVETTSLYEPYESERDVAARHLTDRLLLQGAPPTPHKPETSPASTPAR